jgi:hypothetical protein
MKHMGKQASLITVDGTDIRFYYENEADFISLTDIAKKFSDRTDQIISNWLRTRSTIDFLGAWETLHNADFNPLNFEGIRNQTGSPTFVLTTTDWVESTHAIGIRAKAGRYGGTYAHRDIAYEFLSYLSPTFKLYVIKEFQRLKGFEEKWSLNRRLSKVNYIIHTEAVKSHLIPERVQDTKFESLYYASEADLLNVSLFGMTAKEWREHNPTTKGNIRDYASAEQLLVLANLENLNAEFIKMNLDKSERLRRLNDIAIHQIALLVNTTNVKLLDSGENTPQI